MSKFFNYLYAFYFIYFFLASMINLLLNFVLVGKLMELHGEGSGKATTATAKVGDEGTKIDRPEGYEPPVLESV